MPESRGYTPYLVVVVLLGTAVLATALVGLGADLANGRAPSALQIAITVALAIGSYLVLHDLLLFQWRGQQVALGPDEVLVFVALCMLPAPLVVLFALPAMSAFQFETKRPPLRGATNVAVMLVATATAVLTYGALHTRVPDIIAALAGIAIYTPITFGLVSVAFALRERTSPITVYRERFLMQTGLHLALGATGGVIAIGLWMFYPVAILAMIPVVWGTRAFVQQLARKDRETRVHERLGEVAHELAGEPSLEIVAARVLDACLEIFHAGRATITLNAEPGEGAQRARSWTRDAENGHDPDRAPLAEIVPGPEGPIGAIVVHASRSTKEDFTTADRAVLRIVAGGAASYVAHAHAIADLDASQKELLTQRVARPLVRRIVRTVMEESHADYTVLSRLGNGLARDADASDLETLCRAYEEMGLGTLRVVSANGQYVFSGTDLFERHPGAHSTTCHIALGFLCGAVSRLHAGSTARGSEVACQSRGDASCRFVVQTREPDVVPLTRLGLAEKP